MIESRTTRSFRTAFAALPEEIQGQARRAYRLFRADPSHPSLRFKKVEETENVYSVRIGLGYRALGVLDGSVITWFWIGSHAAYESASLKALNIVEELRRSPRGLPRPAVSRICGTAHQKSPHKCFPGGRSFRVRVATGGRSFSSDIRA